VRIEAAPTATEEVISLVGELETVLSAAYPPEQRLGLALDAIFQPHIRFFLARLRGAAVGCGGVALFSDFAEVKRMYVRDVARGKGVADAIVARIEQEVRDAGLSVLRLETGERQIAAMVAMAADGGVPRVAVHAFLDGRDYCLPDDFKKLAVPVFSHRVVASSRHASLQKKSETTESVLRDIVESVPVPL